MPLDAMPAALQRLLLLLLLWQRLLVHAVALGGVLLGCHRQGRSVLVSSAICNCSAGAMPAELQG
jgi:hypothetical protein